jgi:hypothetical protein
LGINLLCFANIGVFKDLSTDCADRAMDIKRISASMSGSAMISHRADVDGINPELNFMRNSVSVFRLPSLTVIIVNCLTQHSQGVCVLTQLEGLLPG